MLLDGGAIAFKGRPIAGAGPDRIFRMGLARTFQLPELVETQSVEANVVLGAHFCRTGGLGHALAYSETVWSAADEAISLFGLAASAASARNSPAAPV